jgi:DNA-binding HxlR family transcriptional regulator
MVLLRELIAGSTRFNDLRRGVPKMSPSLLAQRLRELESAGIVKRKRIRSEKGVFEYRLTKAGADLRALVETTGSWGQRWVESELSLSNLDATLLMWNMRRNLNPEPLPEQRVVIQFIYTDLAASKRNWWLIVEPDSPVDLCSVDPRVSRSISTFLRVSEP